MISLKCSNLGFLRECHVVWVSRIIWGVLSISSGSASESDIFFLEENIFGVNVVELVELVELGEEFLEKWQFKIEIENFKI